MNHPDHVAVYELGRRPYGPTWDLQKRIQSKLIAAKRSDDLEHVPHVLLLVEHDLVYTLGKSGSSENLLVDENALANLGAEFFRTDRGGDITHHGPGQLVAYPILDLDAVFTDIHRYLRFLEEVVIRTCATFGIETVRVDKRTGVWVPGDGRGPERKICSMGIKCSRWVTMHGLALNVATDLRYFDHIVPCGIRDRKVTSMSQELGRSVTIREVMEPFLRCFAEVFDLRIERTVDADVSAVL